MMQKVLRGGSRSSTKQNGTLYYRAVGWSAVTSFGVNLQCIASVSNSFDVYTNRRAIVKLAAFRLSANGAAFAPTLVKSTTGKDLFKLLRQPKLSWPVHITRHTLSTSARWALAHRARLAQDCCSALILSSSGGCELNRPESPCFNCSLIPNAFSSPGNAWA